MELRQARLAAMALVLVLAGCSQLPSPDGSTAKEPAPLRDAPQQVGNASDQLAELAEPVRTDTALAWARSYLVNERADDAGELLDQVGDGALSRDQRFRWLQLRAQSWMAEQQPDRAVALLDDYRSDIDGFDAQRRAKLREKTRARRRFAFRQFSCVETGLHRFGIGHHPRQQLRRDLRARRTARLPFFLEQRLEESLLAQFVRPRHRCTPVLPCGPQARGPGPACHVR